MNFLKSKLLLLALMGGAVIATVFIYKYYFDNDRHLNKLYNLHRSLIYIYKAPDYPTDIQTEEVIDKSWQNIQKDSISLQKLSKVLKNLPSNYENLTQAQQEEVLLKVHQSYFLKVRQAMMWVRRYYIGLLYSSKEIYHYSGYTPGKKYYPEEKDLSFYKPNLYIQGNAILHKNGKIDYLVIGAGPAGCLIAHELKRKFKNARIVIIDAGPFITPQSMRTDQDYSFMESKGERLTHDESITVKNARVVGGGTIINLGLSYSPLSKSVRESLKKWTKNGWISPRIVGHGKNKWKRLKEIEQWVTRQICHRPIKKHELNKNNALLKSSIPNAKTYKIVEKKNPCKNGGYNRISAIDAFLRPALKEGKGKNASILDVIPSAKVEKIFIEGQKKLKKATGVQIEFKPETNSPKVIKDINKFGDVAGKRFKIEAKNIIISSGAFGSSALLMRSELMNPNIGKGLLLNPSMSLIGFFDNPVNVMDGLYTAVYAISSNPENKYFFESIGEIPSVIAQMIPGFGHNISEAIKNYGYLGGLSVVLIDSVSSKNHIAINPLTEKPQIRYELSKEDKQRFREALKKGVKILFKQGAKKVFLPSMERINNGKLPIFTANDNYEDAIDNLSFRSAENFIISSHMQGTNKMGKNPKKSVVDHKFRVWNSETGDALPNLYLVDSSVFPESLGPNSIQSIYAFAKIFIQKLTDKPMSV